MNRLLCCVVCSLALCINPAEAQQSLAGCIRWNQLSRSIERIGENHLRLTGSVEIDCDATKFYADSMELHTDTNRLVASGSVLYVSGENRISADRMAFDTETRTGTFFNAAGSAFLGDRVDRSMFGTQEPDAYFYGQTIEKLGPRTYRITRGGFTTCVQPTPRWEITSSTATLTLDDHALLRNSVLRVKGVPLFYMPIFYYPLEEDDRATGLLIPTYGTSTFRGQTLSNAFFWAINRSQDATLLHDWFSKTGQGLGGEYRYVAAPGSEGTFRTYWLNEHEVELVGPGGATSAQPARRSYEIRGGATQALPGRLRARGVVDYFSSVEVQSLYNFNIYDASRRQRTLGGNVVGAWGPYNLSGSVLVNELFYGDEDSTLYGESPRIRLGQSFRQIGRAPVYYSVGGEYARLLRESRSGEFREESGLTRIDMAPSVRVPFTRLRFLTVNSSLAWRQTYYSESLDENGDQVLTPLWRRYFDMRSEAVGPVFVRIWDTPGSEYAERFKHVIEPVVEARRITLIDNVDRVVKLEGPDYALGGSTQLRYGVTNRLLAKRLQPNGPSVSREILTVTVQQTYYTDPRVSQIDYSYSTSFRGRPPSKFSPIFIGVKTAPTDGVNASARLEYDLAIGAFQSIGVNASGDVGNWLRTSGGFSRRRLPGDRFQLDNFLSTSTTVRSPGNRFGGTYSFNYDIGRTTLLQQRITGYYNAQCCGFAVEYQEYNVPSFVSRVSVPQDRRFNISFTLAGIGTFSNFFGALGGSQTR